MRYIGVPLCHEFVFPYIHMHWNAQGFDVLKKDIASLFAHLYKIPGGGA